jgi:diketogulonate reductase-like aldo/keto reductase
VETPPIFSHHPRFLTDTESSLLETWKAMEALVDDGLVETIGVSNFGIAEVTSCPSADQGIRRAIKTDG